MPSGVLLSDGPLSMVPLYRVYSNRIFRISFQSKKELLIFSVTNKKGLLPPPRKLEYLATYELKDAAIEFIAAIDQWVEESLLE